LSSIDNTSLRRSKRRKNAPSRSNETNEDYEEHNNNNRAAVDENMEEVVTGQMTESSIEQLEQHLEEDLVLAQATTDESIELGSEAPEEGSEVEGRTSESLEVSGDRAINTAPIEMRQEPGTTNPIQQEMMDEAAEESELGADDDELLDDGLPDMSTLNLRCKVSVDSLFPITRGKGKMRPPPNFLVSAGELLDWQAMTPQEQRASKALWVALSKDEKTRIKDSIPGFDCICCKKKERGDRGRRRGGNAATQRQSARVAAAAGHDAPDDAETQVASFVSLGSSEAERLAALPQKKAPYKRQSAFKLDYARSMQAQGGVQALKTIGAANRSFARALTATTVKPKHVLGQDVYPDPARYPRVYGLQIWVNQVAETPMSGGVLPASRLRRERPVITYVSTGPGDAKQVLDALEDAGVNKEGYEKVKYFGSGKALLDKMASKQLESKSRRSRGSTGADNLQESQDEIPQTMAPTAHHTVRF
jgi:hypothetical protein